MNQLTKPELKKLLDFFIDTLSSFPPCIDDYMMDRPEVRDLFHQYMNNKIEIKENSDGKDLCKN